MWEKVGRRVLRKDKGKRQEKTTEQEIRKGGQVKKKQGDGSESEGKGCMEKHEH